MFTIVKIITMAADNMQMYSCVTHHHDELVMDEVGTVKWSYRGFEYASLTITDVLTVTAPRLPDLNFNHAGIRAVNNRITELTKRYPNHA
jgi:hypothetical protein